MTCFSNAMLGGLARLYMCQLTSWMQTSTMLYVSAPPSPNHAFQLATTGVVYGCTCRAVGAAAPGRSVLASAFLGETSFTVADAMPEAVPLGTSLFHMPVQHVQLFTHTWWWWRPY